MTHTLIALALQAIIATPPPPFAQLADRLTLNKLVR